MFAWGHSRTKIYFLADEKYTTKACSNPYQNISFFPDDLFSLPKGGRYDDNDSKDLS
jgi:hypothetical protein